jgi:hypothetical protein
MIRIGPAGWKYKDWEGLVYPKPAPLGFDELAYIATYFSTLEAWKKGPEEFHWIWNELFPPNGSEAPTSSESASLPPKDVILSACDVAHGATSPDNIAKTAPGRGRGDARATTGDPQRFAAPPAIDGPTPILGDFARSRRRPLRPRPRNTSRAKNVERLSV